jgi:hypothetical protein
MGRINFIMGFITVLNFFNAGAQTDSAINLSEQQFIQGSFTNFYVDNLGNVYLLNANNQIKKINEKGDSVAVANALKRFGDIYSMDVNNSLKIIVYYKDFTTVVVLDRFLKNMNTIDLRKDGILQAKAVAVSYDNNYWVFDEVDNKLKKIDDNGNLLLSTPDLRTVFDESFVPEKIIDCNGYVYLYNKNEGCKVFDYYGALKQNIPALSWDNIQVIKNSILGFDTTSLHVYSIDLFKENEYLFNPQINGVLKLQKSGNDLYALKTDGLHIYSIK